MKLQYKMPNINNLELSITITMTVEQWRTVMRSQYHSDQEDFKNLIASALGDVTRLSTASYQQPKED